MGDTMKKNFMDEEIPRISCCEQGVAVHDNVSTALTLFSLSNRGMNEDGRDLINERQRINQDRQVDNVNGLLRLSIGLGIVTCENSGERHQETEGKNNPWVIEKKLYRSDVDESARLLIGNKQIEKHVLPFLNEEEIKSLHCSRGLQIGVFDVERREEFTLNLKKWKTGSFVFTNNWSKDFVRRRELVENDKIGLYFDDQNSRLCFCVLDKVPFSPLSGRTRKRQNRTRKRQRQN